MSITVLVVGTGTEVGKTWVTAATIRALRARGVDACARKPVQSFSPEDVATDADVLAEASGEDPHTVCPPHRWLPVPMAPPMAAAALGLPLFSIAQLVTELTTPGTLALVEGAGGIRSPIAADGDNVDLADVLAPSLTVLVADAGLGAINLVRLCAPVLKSHPFVVFLNRFDPHDDVQARNRHFLVTRERLEVVTDPEALAARFRSFSSSR